MLKKQHSVLLIIGWLFIIYEYAVTIDGVSYVESIVGYFNQFTSDNINIDSIARFTA